MNRHILPGPLPVRIALWLLLYAVCPLSGTAVRFSLDLEVWGRITLPACSEPEPFVLPECSSEENLGQRVFDRLVEAADREPHSWFADDYLIARQTVLMAGRGVSDPHLQATVYVLGLQPEKVWPAIVAKRKAQLGSMYSAWYDENDLPRPNDLEAFLGPVKKPVRSVTLKEFRQRNNAA